MHTNQSLKTLKNKVLQGGIYLTIRQLAASALSLVSVLVIARVLGPENYGVVVSAAFILYFTFWTAKCGLDVYSIRQPTLPKDAAEQILAFYNTVGIGLCVLLWFATPLVGAWTGQSVLVEVLRWLVPVIWLEMVASASIAMMERELRFPQVGLVETLAQVSNYAVSVPLVLLNWGYWGPIAGFVVQFTLLAVMASVCYPIAWRWRWQPQFISSALRSGLAYSGSNLIWNFKTLTVPLVVSRLGGLEAAGIVGIAIRLSDQLGMLRIVIARLSISTLAKLLGDTDALRRAISRGIIYQGLLVGPVFALFSCCANWIVPLMFGKSWLPSTQVFTFVALATLLYTVFNMHISALYAAGHNRDVARFNAIYISLFWLAAWLLLPVLGAWGYGVAELFALPSFLALHFSITRLCGAPDYGDAICLIIATAIPLLAGPWLPFYISLSLLVASYSILFLARPTLRSIPLELYAAWKTPKPAK
ncbi:oligosaccharide flippase family protein [Chroococcidiopsis sp. CCNUC1]|jgi:O-antigen/teichoic acid export membrane protein|uniref:oligosaccharide flippase family protein n=1 Tax=Chroococcidiopsis sp. CCNUC1 TaxID=2653189 RepID=UPI0020217884|nr:oligosaccharide flippase family protein [Chroococcidiopsis sp. CCNUC1]URD48302.1 oligosaccharide flippase family protein [Chroococcidiopsis sp. CCNUC1]